MGKGKNNITILIGDDGGGKYTAGLKRYGLVAVPL